MLRNICKPFGTLGLVAMLGLVACGGDDGPVGPESPTEATALAVSLDGNSATITWTPGENLASQRVELSGPGETLEQEVSGSANSATFADLAFGADYTAQVVSINSDATARSAPLSFVVAANVEYISNDILADESWTNDKMWVLQGPVFVGADVGMDGGGGTPVTLTIEPGTTILGGSGVSARGSYLIVSRGSRLIADANNPDFGGSGMCERPNAEDVIVFTSDQPRGERARGDWGGLVLNGRAPTNAGAEAEGEGDSGLYGGPDEMDSSGILRGVRVEFAGDDVTATDQLNGIAYQGVGHGTTVCYTQVHHNVDDGTEPFGVGPTQTHMVMSGIGDDSFDGTDGYNGFVQFGIAQQIGDDADNGFELSNNGDDEDATPKSTGVWANVTLIGARDPVQTGDIAGPESDVGVLLREGAYFRLFNNIVTGFGSSGFDVEGAQAAQNADRRLAGETDPALTLRFESNILWNNGGGEPGGDTNFADASGDGYTQAENKAFFEAFANILADPGLPESAFNVGSRDNPPNFIPPAMPAGYTAFDVSTLNGQPGLTMPADGRTLAATNYAGAVEPGIALEDAWYYGWTVWTTDGSDSRPNEEGL